MGNENGKSNGEKKENKREPGDLICLNMATKNADI
jgi:hypothetical protein